MTATLTQMESEARGGAPDPAHGALVDTVEIWTALLDAQSEGMAESLASLLSADERARAERFRFARDQRRYEVGRGILRVLLGHHANLRPNEIAFQYGPGGKPSLAGDQQTEPALHFNLAHTGGLAMYAVTRAGPVGLDVEHIRPIPEWREIAATEFSAAQRARVHAASDAQRWFEFSRAWTQQEAVLKAMGEGLGSVRRIAIRDSVAGPGAVSGSDLRVQDLPAPAGNAAAIAVGRAARRVVLRQWPPADDPGGVCARATMRIQMATLPDQANDSL